jgi:hypothetical protein
VPLVSKVAVCAQRAAFNGAFVDHVWSWVCPAEIRLAAKMDKTLMHRNKWWELVFIG